MRLCSSQKIPPPKISPFTPHIQDQGVEGTRLLSSLPHSKLKNHYSLGPACLPRGEFPSLIFLSNLSSWCLSEFAHCQWPPRPNWIVIRSDSWAGCRLDSNYYWIWNHAPVQTDGAEQFRTEWTEPNPFSSLEVVGDLMHSSNCTKEV